MSQKEFSEEKIRDAHRADELTKNSGQWTVADDSSRQEELDEILAEFDSIEELEEANWRKLPVSDPD